jgi:hypothetical protein
MLSRLCTGGAILCVAVLLIGELAVGQQPPPQTETPSRETPSPEAERRTRANEPWSPTSTGGAPITAYLLELLGLLATPTRGAPIVLTPSISISEEYNDNIFLVRA